MTYKCINFEGLDQVGKGDAVKNLSYEVSQLGYKTSVISFPYYATPLGFLIRDILVNGLPSNIKVSKSKELELKMALFALNRLEILNCLLCDKKYDVYIFDRGPFSCALTIGYHISSYKDELKKGSQYTDKGLYFDSYFREVLNVDNCVIYLKHKGIEWQGSRQKEGDDLYERNEVQRISASIYEIFEEKIKDGWNNVITKDEKGWRDREEIKRECIDFGNRRDVLSKELPKRKGACLRYLGIKEIQKFLYTGSRVNIGLKGDWMSAIQCNDKKEVYRVSELVSGALASSTGSISWCDIKMVLFINQILREYPQIYDLICYRYGHEFADKFRRSLI